MKGDDRLWKGDGVYLMESDALHGVPVFSADGRTVGRLEKAVLGRRSGSVGYVVLTTRRWWGLVRERHVLPWRSLTADAARGGFVVDPLWERGDPEQAHGSATVRRLDPARPG